MNRFYYINKIYDYILEKERPEGIGTLESIDLKKQIEAGLMYTYHEHYKEEENLSDASDFFYEWIHDHENMIETLFTNEAINDWAKENKELLKLQ